MNYEDEGDMCAIILVSGAPNDLDIAKVKEKF